MATGSAPPPAILVSIKPRWVEAIARGVKTVELRRTFPDLPAGTWLYIYSTLPDGALVGRVQILGVDTLPASEIWSLHGEALDLSRREFDDYLDGCEEAAAVLLGSYEPLPRLALSEMRRRGPFHPPQRFRYLDSGELETLAETS